MERIKTEGMKFLDEQGRERIFRGVNLKCFPESVTEEAPLGFLAWLDDEFFKRSEALGFQMLRLGVTWSTLEPEKGQYNEVFLAGIDHIFDQAAKHGMYVFIDLHQDLYSVHASLAGNGAPAWACDTDGLPAKPAKFVWAEGYFWGKAVHTAFDHFWNNDPVLGKGLLEHFEELWVMLAERYGEHPAFFGFDLLNEPFPGTAGGKAFRKLIAKLVRVCAVSPSVKRIKFLKTALNKETRGYALDVLTPEVLEKVTRAATPIVKKFDEELYSPFIARLTKAVRGVTPNGMIFMEHCYYSNLGVPSGAVPPPGEKNVIYSPHGYDFSVDTPAYDYANNARVGFMFDQARATQERLNVPVIVGEWGGGGEGEGFFPHITYLMDHFDRYHWSNTYFTYSRDLYDNPIVRVIARPYPAAVNGAIKSFVLDEASKTFTLDYTPKGGDGLTEIFLPAGYASVDAGANAEVSTRGSFLLVKTDAPRIVVKYN